MDKHMIMDSHNENHTPYTIANIYFDTPDDYLIRASLSKPEYKEKLRLRAYGIPNRDSMVFLEIKKKFNGIVNKRRAVLTLEEASKILENVDIILPKKREYFIENLYSHYKHTMYIEPLDETRKIIEAKYPEYLKEFDLLHKRTSAHMFNMMIMKKELLNEYCEWVFDILFELESKIDTTKYDSFHSRFYGRVSELLLDVWIKTKCLKYEEVKVIDIEKINWFKKGFAFLMAKFTGKKYGKSF